MRQRLGQDRSYHLSEQRLGLHHRRWRTVYQDRTADELDRRHSAMRNLLYCPRRESEGQCDGVTNCGHGWPEQHCDGGRSRVVPRPRLDLIGKRAQTGVVLEKEDSGHGRAEQGRGRKCDVFGERQSERVQKKGVRHRERKLVELAHGVDVQVQADEHRIFHGRDGVVNGCRDGVGNGDVRRHRPLSGVFRICTNVTTRPKDGQEQQGKARTSHQGNSTGIPARRCYPTARLGTSRIPGSSARGGSPGLQPQKLRGATNTDRRWARLPGPTAYRVFSPHRMPAAQEATLNAASRTPSHGRTTRVRWTTHHDPGQTHRCG